LDGVGSEAETGIFSIVDGTSIPKSARRPKVWTQTFSPAFQERFSPSSGVEDKFRRLLLRFERISELHYALKSLAR